MDADIKQSEDAKKTPKAPQDAPTDWNTETQEIENTKKRLEEATKAAEELGDYFSKTPENQLLQWIKEDRKTR